MIRRPPRSTRTDTLFPYTTLFRSRTFFIATALVRAGVGLTVVDSFTTQAALAPGLAVRPLKPPLTFDLYAMHLLNRPPTAVATDFLKVVSAVIDSIKRGVMGASTYDMRWAWMRAGTEGRGEGKE